MADIVAALLDEAQADKDKPGDLTSLVQVSLGALVARPPRHRISCVKKLPHKQFPAEILFYFGADGDQA